MTIHKSQRTVWVAMPVALLMLSAGCRDDKSNPQVVENQAPPAEVVREAPPPQPSRPPVSRPAPQPVVRTIPAGTTLSLELLETLASNTNQTGDRFRARVTQDVLAGGNVAIPAGSEVTGVVTEARSLRKIGGRAKLQLEFTSVEPPSGRPSELKASYLALGKSETKKDAATIGGAAVGGAILGRVLGHKKDDEAKGTAVGAAAGAAIGTAVAAGTKGKEVVLPAGHVIQVALDASTQVTLKG